MNITISFKNMEHTPTLDKRIKKKSKKLDKYLNGKTSVKWTCHIDDGHHYAEIILTGPKFEYHATASSENLYKTLDLVVDKITRQIAKKKEKLTNKVHRKKADLVILDPEQAWTDYEEAS